MAIVRRENGKHITKLWRLKDNEIICGGYVVVFLNSLRYDAMHTTTTSRSMAIQIHVFSGCCSLFLFDMCPLALARSLSKMSKNAGERERVGRESRGLQKHLTFCDFRRLMMLILLLLLRLIFGENTTVCTRRMYISLPQSLCASSAEWITMPKSEFVGWGSLCRNTK